MVEFKVPSKEEANKSANLPNIVSSVLRSMVAQNILVLSATVATFFVVKGFVIKEENKKTKTKQNKTKTFLLVHQILVHKEENLRILLKEGILKQFSTQKTKGVRQKNKGNGREDDLLTTHSRTASGNRSATLPIMSTHSWINASHSVAPLASSATSLISIRSWPLVRNIIFFNNSRRRATSPFLYFSMSPASPLCFSSVFFVTKYSRKIVHVSKHDLKVSMEGCMKVNLNSCSRNSIIGKFDEFSTRWTCCVRNRLINSVNFSR
jgi:hypothetical protein